MIQIYLDSHIAIPGLTSEWIQGLSKLVSVENEEKKRAIKEHVWNAHKQDDFLTLADLDEKYLYLPRGFLNELTTLLKESGHEYQIDDQTTWNGFSSSIQKWPELSAEQQIAVTKTVAKDQGRIIMPPGKGKTVVGLYGALENRARTLILVQQKHIAQQWVNNAKDLFGFDIGFIGDGKWDEKEITVALLQTLWSKRESLSETFTLEQQHIEDAWSWWDKWDMVILDEQHHIPAETFTYILQKFSARKRFGFSATIGKTPAQARISELVFGPILYESKEVNIKPEVEVVDTEFEFDYYPTEKYIKPNGKQGIKRNNYKDLVNTLINDQDRNVLVAAEIGKRPYACHLIVSDRIKHLDDIIFHCEDHEGEIYKLTGKESLDERMEIYEKADKGSCAIFSTVASEALDIPRIDVIHLCYPRSNIEAIWQIIGRGTRTHPDKQSAKIIDYRDKNCSILLNQFRKRLQLYKKKGLKINTPSR